MQYHVEYVKEPAYMMTCMHCHVIGASLSEPLTCENGVP